MNWRRSALLGCLAVLVTVLVSSAPAPPRDMAPSAPRSSDRNAVRPAAPFEADEVAARLRARSTTAPAPRSPGRNPFDFEQPPQKPAAIPAHAAAPALPTAPLVPPPPPLTLSGIAETQQGDRLVRTAMIAGAGPLLFAKVGDKLANRYDVTAIGPDIVELRDSTDGRVLKLVLR
jgi:hypothetical protein